ncbi:MAG: lipid II flippase MurJ, partial [Acidiferrobacterales bacterium]
VGLIVLAKPILTTLFQYGQFGPYDVEMTSRALIAFSFGLVAFITVKILALGFYARQNTSSPAKIAAWSVVANIILSLALISSLAHTGLALSISLAAFVNAGLLFRLLRKDGIYTPLSGWSWLVLRIGVASTLMALVLGWGAGDMPGWIAAGVFLRVVQLGLWISVGILVYIASMLMLGARPRDFLLRSIEQTDG